MWSLKAKVHLEFLPLTIKEKFSKCYHSCNTPTVHVFSGSSLNHQNMVKYCGLWSELRQTTWWRVINVFSLLSMETDGRNVDYAAGEAEQVSQDHLISLSYENVSPWQPIVVSLWGIKLFTATIEANKGKVIDANMSIGWSITLRLIIHGNKKTVLIFRDRQTTHTDSLTNRGINQSRLMSVWHHSQTTSVSSSDSEHLIMFSHLNWFPHQVKVSSWWISVFLLSPLHYQTFTFPVRAAELTVWRASLLTADISLQKQTGEKTWIHPPPPLLFILLPSPLLLAVSLHTLFLPSHFIHVYHTLSSTSHTHSTLTGSMPA